MDCNTARLLLAFAGRRASELDADEAQALDGHLAECPECARRARDERAADVHLGAAMRAVTLPSGLRERLLARLTADRAEQHRRSVWARGRWVAAAAILLGVALWFLWHARQPRPLDLEAVAYDYFQKRANPSAEMVQEWFQSKHLAVLPPTDFNYRLLTYFGLADLQGEQVPLVLFTAGDDQALVYVLSDKDFDLRSLAPTAVSGCNVAIRPLADGHSAYLILYTGPSLDRFLAQKSDGAP